MKTTIATMFCVAALLATPAIAQQTPATKDVAMKENATTVSCRPIYHEGTALAANKTCLTAAQWRFNRARIQQDFREDLMRANFERIH